MREKEKAVVILSGGIDSSTLLFTLKEKNCELFPITFLYGQKHYKEIESAKRITDILRVPHRVIDISSISTVLRSALTNSQIAIPLVSSNTLHFDSLKDTVVPYRNAILLSIAIGYAESIEAFTVYYGAHYSDRGMYPDCRKEFISTFENAAKLGTGNSNLSIKAPFVDLKKKDIISIGYKLRVPFHLTWSCYSGGQYHCGQCSSCAERITAFKESNVYDPTIYLRN